MDTTKETTLGKKMMPPALRDACQLLKDLADEQEIMHYVSNETDVHCYLAGLAAIAECRQSLDDLEFEYRRQMHHQIVWHRAALKRAEDAGLLALADDPGLVLVGDEEFGDV